MSIIIVEANADIKSYSFVGGLVKESYYRRYHQKLTWISFIIQNACNTLRIYSIDLANNKIPS